MNLHQWAIKHAIPYAALADLQYLMGLDGGDADPDAKEGESEIAAETRVVLEAARLGFPLWKNNVGVLQDETGRPVRYGLANDSARLNKVIKSSDRIGCRPVVIEPHHVGYTIGRFVAREMKKPGWRYTGQGREPAQLAFINRVLALGGDAAFATGVGTL